MCKIQFFALQSLAGVLKQAASCDNIHNDPWLPGNIRLSKEKSLWAKKSFWA